MVQRKTGRLVLFILVAMLMSVFLTGCKDFDKPEIQTIEPSQTAFLIPLVGDTTDQKGFGSEEFLESKKIATKQIQIPHRWVQTGRSIPGIWDTGSWIPSAKLIVVERKPETREWTESEKDGTSNKNEGIVAETKESIGFMARMNASAQIDEADATKFLYRYNNKSLSDVMDTEIRARIESKFVEEVAKRNLDDVLVNKETIMKSVRDDVTSFFKERGITVTTLGLKGEFTYLNAGIQKSIDAKFQAAKDKETQSDVNAKVISKANADAEAIRVQASTLQDQIKLRELENQKAWIDRWDGKLPTTELGSGSNTMFNLNK